MTQQQEYLTEKLMLTITAMGAQGLLMEEGKTTTPAGIPRTQRLQTLQMKALKFLFELEGTLKQ